MFQNIALVVIRDGTATRIEMSVFKDLYQQLNDNIVKEIVK